MMNSITQDNKLMQVGRNAALGACASSIGLLLLKGVGLKFEVVNLPPKSFFTYAVGAGCVGASAHEISNYIGSALGVSDQNKERLNLVAVAVFTIGAIVLSQNGRIRSLPYVGRVVSWMPQLASHNQMLAVALSSAISMVGMRCIFGNTKRSPNSAPEEVPMSRSNSEANESEGEHSAPEEVPMSRSNSEANESEGEHSAIQDPIITSTSKGTESEGED